MFLSFSSISVVICVMRVVVFRHSEVREMGSCTENAPQMILTTVKLLLFLGVLSTKGYPECVLPVENSVPVFLSQMVRKVAVPSWNPELRAPFSLKSCSSSKSSTRFWLSLCTTTVQLLFLLELLLMCYCWCFWRGFIWHWVSAVKLASQA